MTATSDTRSNENKMPQVQNIDKQNSQSTENTGSAQPIQDSQSTRDEDSFQRNQDSQSADNKGSAQPIQDSQSTRDEDSFQRNQNSQSRRNEVPVERNENPHLPFQQSYQMQTPLRYPNSPDSYHQPQIYVLPYLYPPYPTSRYDVSQPQYAPPSYTSQDNSVQLGQPNVNQYGQSRPSNEHPVQPSPTNEHHVQSRQPNEHPMRPGGQTTEQSNYGPQSYQPPPPQNIMYVHPYHAQPPSPQGSPMVRPGRGFRDRDEPEPEPVLKGWEGFENSKIRRSFVRKVYIILMLQLLCSLAVIALFVFEPNVKRFVQSNRYLYYISLAIFFAVYVGMACFESVRRKYPTNIIVLVVFTLAASYMLGTVSSTYNTEAVFMAVGICAAVCLTVSVFSFYTKFDFTGCGGILYILLLVLFLFGLIAIFIPSKIMTMIYGGAGAILFSMYLAYDTQLLMGGKKYELSPEEHVFAAVQLYVDIINIYLFILMLCGINE